MILLDSDAPMYLVGAPHAHKLDAQRRIEAAISRREALATDAAVLQEICHRYAAIGRRDAIQPAFDAVLGIVDRILPIEREDAEQAKDVLLQYAGLSARGAIHVAVMRRHRIERLLSFDRGFDVVPGIERIA